MKNVSLALKFLVVLLITKLNSAKWNQLNTQPKSSAEDKLNTEMMEEIALEDVSLHSVKVDLNTKARKIASDPEMKYMNHDNKDQSNSLEDLEAPSNKEFESLDSHDQVDVLNQYMDYYNELEDSLNDLDSKLKWYEGNPNPPEESSDYNEIVDYYEELTNILGTKFEDVEVLLKQDKIEISKKDQVETNNPNNFSLKKSKVYAVHPYQIKSEEATPSVHGPFMYLSNEDEDKSSPHRYYQQHGRKSKPQYSYLPKKKDQLLKLFPGLASESKPNNQPLRSKTKFQHDTIKEESLLKIVLERINTGWPFGYDITQKPSEYSLMHKVNLNHHPQ